MSWAAQLSASPFWDHFPLLLFLQGGRVRLLRSVDSVLPPLPRASAQVTGGQSSSPEPARAAGRSGWGEAEASI